MRIYSFDRIEDMHLADERFTIPADFMPEDYFANCYGIAVDGGEPQRIALWGSGKQDMKILLSKDGQIYD